MWTTSRVSTVLCVANMLFLTLEQVLVEFGVLECIDVYVDRKVFLHEHFVPPPEVASLSQQGRIATLSALARYSV